MKNHLPRELVTVVRPGGHPTVTRVRRTATFRLVGEPATRACPHTITTWDEITDPVQGEHHRERTYLRRTLTPCERTDGHYRDLDHPEQAAHKAGGLTW